MSNPIKRTASVFTYATTMPVRPRTTSPRPSSPLSKFVTTEPDGTGGWIRQSNGEWEWERGEGKWIRQANGKWGWLFNDRSAEDAY